MPRSIRLVTAAAALCAVALSGSASARVPDGERRPVRAAFTDARPCQHHLQVDAKTGAPVGRPSTYGARCIAV